MCLFVCVRSCVRFVCWFCDVDVLFALIVPAVLYLLCFVILYCVAVFVCCFNV